MFRTTVLSLQEIRFIKPIKPQYHTGLQKFSTSDSWKQRGSVINHQKISIMDNLILRDILFSNQPEELKCLRLSKVIY